MSLINRVKRVVQSSTCLDYLGRVVVTDINVTSSRELLR
jgi:hypothetical protein